MAEAQIKLGYILDPLFQVENNNGKPVVGGYIEVYEAGTNIKYITYQNFDYTQNQFRIPLGSDGRAVVLGSMDLAYDVYVYDSFGNLIVSRLNVAAGDAGGAGGGGLREVIHDNTLTGKGTQLAPLGVSPLTNLAVDETLTAYEATISGQDALVLGVNGDWFNNQMSSAFEGKVDTSAFEECCSAVNVALDNKADIDDLSNFYTKNETYNNFLPRSAYLNSGDYYEKSETYNRLEIEALVSGKQNELIFGYDSDSAISSINNSAIGGQGASYPASAEDAVQYVVNNSATINEVNNTYESNSGSYLTAHQPISSNEWNSNYNTVNSNSAKWNNISVYQNNSANYFTTGAANTISSMLSGAIDYVSANIGQVISGDYELSAGYGVTLTDFSADHITRIDVTGGGMTGDYVPLNSAFVSATQHSNYLFSANYNMLGNTHQLSSVYIPNPDVGQVTSVRTVYTNPSGFNYTSKDSRKSYTVTTEIGGVGVIAARTDDSAGYVVGFDAPMGDSIYTQWFPSGCVYHSKNMTADNVGLYEDVIFDCHSLLWYSGNNPSQDVYNTISASATWAQIINLTAGGSSFPMSGTDGTASFTADMNSSAIYLSTAQGVAGLTTKFTGKGVQYQAYPSTNVSASWYNIIKGANISSVKLTTAQASYTFTTDEIRHLSQINIATPYTYSGPSTYSVTLGTKTFSNLDSGCYYDFMRAEVEGTESWVIGPTGAYSLL